jgi:hypothetical protein
MIENFFALEIIEIIVIIVVIAIIAISTSLPSSLPSLLTDIVTFRHQSLTQLIIEAAKTTEMGYFNTNLQRG